MSTTKVTDNLRDTTEVDAAKITTGTIPEARITSLDATKLTGTVADARFPATLPASSGANLTALPAGNLTGTVADARLSTVTSSKLSGNLPAISGASLTGLNASNLGTGTVPTARLGSGTASSSTFLRGDSTYAEAGGGGILQVKSTTKKDTATSTSTSFAAISGLSVSITPSSSSNKILVSWHAGINGEATGSCLAVYRDGSMVPDFAPTSSGSRPQGMGQFYEGDSSDISNCAGMALDNPASTSSLTYQLYWHTPNQTIYLNRCKHTEDSAWYVRVVSSITVMEVASSVL